MLALTKDDGNDADMAEMISYEIDSLSKQLSELEDKLKVCFNFIHLLFIFGYCKLQFFVMLCHCL